MTRRRWIADESSGDFAALTGPHADHLSRVLRAQVGQQFDIAVDGVVRRGTISEVTDQRVEFTLGEEVETTPVADITLALAIFKFDRMEWAIEKCTEIGVSRFVPIIAQRTEAHLATAAAKRVERWRRIARQASEQSRRISLPNILEPIKIQKLFAIESGLPIVMSEIEDSVFLKEVLKQRKPNQSVTLAFGPEGGWVQPELDLFQRAGWASASLGPTVLRSETAAIAATAVTMSELQ